MSSNVRQRRPAEHSTILGSRTPRPAVKSNRLLKWEDLPVLAKDNEYIHSGFRPSTNSYKDCWHSCFYVHNETGNIYSHLVATLWMITLPIVLYPYAKEHYPGANVDDWTVFGLFFLGGALCFGLSTIYHVLSSHSHAVHDVYLRLDFLGISTVTAGCFPPGVWYTFPCASRETRIFWIGLDLAAQLMAAIFVLFVRRFRKSAWRPFRGFLFSFMASSAFYPIIYACFLNGYRQMEIQAGANRYTITVLLYLTAVTIYGVSEKPAQVTGDANG